MSAQHTPGLTKRIADANAKTNAAMTPKERAATDRIMAAQHTPGPVLAYLDFVVVNHTTGNAVAAFLLPADAVRYIKERTERYGANGQVLTIVNADGSPISLQLAEQVEAVREAAWREHTRLYPQGSGS